MNRAGGRLAASAAARRPLAAGGSSSSTAVLAPSSSASRSRAAAMARRYASDTPPSRTGINVMDHSQLQPQGGSLGRRLLFYLTFGTLAFYGGSAFVATRSDRYNTFFTESVPLGEKVMDYVESHDLGEVSVGEAVGKAAEVGQGAYRAVSGAVSRTLGGAEDAVANGEKDVRTLMAEARDKAAREARKAKLDLKTAGKDAQEKGDELYNSAKQRSEELVAKAREAAQRAEEEVRSKTQGLVDGVKSAKDSAVRETRSIGNNLKSVAGGESIAPASYKASAPVGEPAKPWSEPLPLQHEPPVGYVAPRSDRKLTPEAEPKAALRPDPGAPKLPLLAPAISQLANSSSEPVIAQLASTIDDLAQFLKDAPATSSFQAKDVLNLARADLEKLTDRLEAIKKKEAARVDATLKQQKAKYESELAKTQERAQQDLSKKDAEWHANLEKERAQQVKEYEAKLQKELATQSEIINERLREEVIAQGIELQRRWMRDIKARVEQERGGRLARLDELATQVKHLEAVAKENEKEMETTNKLNTLTASVRALQSLIDAPGQLEAADGAEAVLAQGKVPFRDSLRAVKANAAATDSAVISGVLDFLDKSSIPDEGVDSLITLSTWFQDKVSPAILRTALLPENAGVLAHATSALIAPLLFKKRASAAVSGAVGQQHGADPNVQDVPGILARAEYLLQREDLDGAAREVNQLQGWGKILTQDWLAAARKRLEVSQALDAVRAETRYLSLLSA